jgi:hypothetical protein
MGTGAGTEHILLSDHGAVVDVASEHGPDAWMLVSAGPDDVRPWPCARLVERAVEEAWDHSVRRIDTALDLAAPSTGVLLQALRRHVGREITSLSMHRAGASAMVTIVLSPPRPAAPVAPDSAPALPSQRGVSSPRPGVPTDRRRRPWSLLDGHRRTGRGHRSSRQSL